MNEPRTKDGRFVSRSCPVCGNGTLQREDNVTWSCDGLRDPEHNDQEVIACEYHIYDGEVFIPSMR